MEKTYKPTDEDKKIIFRVYGKIKEMIDISNKKYPEFNNRTLREYIDDNEKRVNSYVEPKESQGKEDWQSNVALPTIRDKMKRIIAGFALTVPDLTIEAKDESGDVGVETVDRADIAEKLIYASYEENDNPVINHFWEAWQCGLNGTVIEYEGYLKTNLKQKFIKEYDMETGKVKFDEREVNVEDACVSYIVPLSEIFLPTYNIHDIQEMPEMAWVRYYDEDLFNYEFGKYKNAQHVKKSSGMRPDVDTFFHKADWSIKERAGQEKIEVIRYYNRLNDEYIIIANGILILNAPLLWQFNGRKCYPFAKTILEPFANQNFFYGKGMADVLMGQYDLLNTYFNTTMDKGFRSLNPPTLIGTVNQDSFDLEDDIMMSDTKIYVDDVNQVSPMPIPQTSQADVQMIQILAKGLEDAAPSMPHLLQDKTATAREVVIAEEKMREMKSVYHEMLVELWRQKLQLRLANIITNYPYPRKVYKDGEEQLVYRTFLIKDTLLDRNSGEKGTMAIQFRGWENNKEKRILEDQAAIEEEAMAMQGINYRKKIVKPDFLDNFLYKINVIPDSLHKTSMAKMQVSVQEEISMVANFFPEIFMANQEKYFEDLAKAHGRDGTKAIRKFRELMAARQEQQQGEQGMGEQATGEPTMGDIPMDGGGEGGPLKGTAEGTL